MAIVEELIGKLGFQIGDKRAVTEFERTLDRLERKAKRTSASISKAGRSAGAAFSWSGGGIGSAPQSGHGGGLFAPRGGGRGMSPRRARMEIDALGGSIAALGAGYGIKQSLVGFATFERQMSRIGITAGATIDETNRAGNELRAFANKFAIPVEQTSEGLNVLVSAGMNLKQAMSFLPSVLGVAQASGAATQDIANTAQKSAQAFGLAAGDMSLAFDTMVTGGKLGQFELRDMATYLPTLSAQFAALGYKGQDGLRRLIALLQTARIQTGTAEEAARNAENLFGKIYSEETAKKFNKAGVNLSQELEKGQKAGKDLLEIFVDLTQQATKGDERNLAKFFEDTQVRKMMIALLQLRKEWGSLYRALDPSKVIGSTGKDLQRILANTQAGMDRLKNSADGLANSLGAALAPIASPAMDFISRGLEQNRRADELRSERGETGLQRWLKWGSYSGNKGILEGEAAWRSGQRQRSGMSHLYASPGVATGVPSILRGGRPARRSRTGGLNYPGRSVYGAGGASPSASDRVAGAFDALGDVGARTVSTKFIADVSSFLDPASQAQKIAMDLNTVVTTRFTADLSDLQAKVAEAKRLVASVPSFRAGGFSGVTPARIGGAGTANFNTPARVVGAGAAP